VFQYAGNERDILREMLKQGFEPSYLSFRLGEVITTHFFIEDQQSGIV